MSKKKHHLSRGGHGRASAKKPKAQAWMVGQQAKQAARQQARAEDGRASARLAREQAARRMQPSRKPPSKAAVRKLAKPLGQDAKQVQRRNIKRRQRDNQAAATEIEGPKQAAAAQRRDVRAEAAALTKDIGREAATRHAQFAREGRTADASRQAAEYQQRLIMVPIKKLLRKGLAAQAAAAVAAATMLRVRQPPCTCLTTTSPPIGAYFPKGPRWWMQYIAI
mmetsp:Transcript_37348/g.98802  ORF Transcript_37348/g.98802 Transcript_37348/m.98802 type:complete len:223 (+) Transcript_37348:139-807(+)